MRPPRPQFARPRLYPLRAMRAAPAAILLAAAAAAALGAGCAKPATGSSALSFRSSDYHAVFDAALEAARADKLHPVVVDRELGVIETDARTAGSLFEPWRTDNSGLEEGIDHTVNFERRRARFEFVPAGFSVPPPQPDQRIESAALPGTDRAQKRVDLARYEGVVEMRVWVFVDRAFRPNQRLGTWTRGEMRYAVDPLDKQDPEDETTRANTTWTPIGRDVPYERRLGTRVQTTANAVGVPVAAIPDTPAASPEPPH